MRQSTWDRTIWPPVYPAGANNLETRLRVLETHFGYMLQEMRELQQENAVLRTEIQDAAKRGALWIISTLVTVIMGLGLVVIKVRFPELVP